ncbi:MAG: rhomboid family intramembrane serine protease [Chloroflexota bacterium]
MSQPGHDRSTNDYDEMIRRLDDEARRQREDSDGYPQGDGETGQAQAQRAMRLPLPMGTPRAYIVLLVVNVIIFAIPWLLDLVGVRVGGFTTSEIIRGFGAKINDAIQFNGEYYRFLTAMFLHGGLLHMLFNGYALFAIGPETERVYGTSRFVILYFIAGFAGGVASYALTPAPSVGASGAIFGMIGALAVFFYIARDVLGQMARDQLGGLVTVIVLNLFIGFSVPNIDNMGHIGGLIGGVAVGWFLAPRFAIDQTQYPPVVVRRSLPSAWIGTASVVVLLLILVLVVPAP